MDKVVKPFNGEDLTERVMYILRQHKEVKDKIDALHAEIGFLVTRATSCHRSLAELWHEPSQLLDQRDKAITLLENIIERYGARSYKNLVFKIEEARDFVREVRDADTRKA